MTDWTSWGCTDLYYMLPSRSVHWKPSTFNCAEANLTGFDNLPPSVVYWYTATLYTVRYRHRQVCEAPAWTVFTVTFLVVIAHTPYYPFCDPATLVTSSSSWSLYHITSTLWWETLAILSTVPVPHVPVAHVPYDLCISICAFISAHLQSHKPDPIRLLVIVFVA